MAFSKVKVGGLADDSVTAANIDDDGTGYTVGNLTNSGTLQQTGQATFGSGGTNWTLPTARGTDKYVLQINGTTGAADWAESLVAPEISSHNFDVSGSTDDGGINAYEAPYAYTGTTTNASTTISSLSSTTGLKAGQYISGAGIPADTTISSVGSGSIVISNQATAAGTGVALKIQKTPGEKNGGKVILTGTNFGVNVADISVAITNSNGGVIANASYISGLSGTSVTAEWTGTEGNYSTELTSSYTGKIYFKVTKSGLASNVYDTNTTLTSDATVTTLTTSSQTGGNRSALTTDVPSVSSLGGYGGRTLGGGQESNTTILLNFDRTGGTDFEDSSNVGGAGTKVSVLNNTIIKASPFGDGKSAIFFDGVNDKLSIPDSDDWYFGTGSFTIEMFLHIVDMSHVNYLFYTGNSSSDNTEVTVQGNGQVTFSSYDGSYNISANSPTGTIKANTWHHLAIVRDSSGTATFKIFLDGVAQDVTIGQGSAGGDLHNMAVPLIIGECGYDAGNRNFDGYLDEYRIVKGVAVYTGDFDVPTSRLSATQSNQGTNIADITGTATKLLIHSDHVDDPVLSRSKFDSVTELSASLYKHANTNSTLATVPTGLNDGAATFSNSNNQAVYIKNPSSTGLFGITTGDFTIDMWIWCENGHDARLFSSGTSNWPMMIYLSTSRQLQLYFGDGVDSWDYFGGSSLGFTAPNQTWCHICLARKGTSLFFWGDGILTFTNTTGTNNSNLGYTGEDVIIGANYNITGEQHYGNIKNVRVSNNFRAEQANDPCYVAGTAGTTTGGAVGNGSSFAAFDKTSSSANANFIYTGDGTGTGGGVDQNTMCFAKFDNSVITDSSSSPKTITVYNGANRSQSHGGIAPAMTWPASGKTKGTSGAFFDGTTDVLNLNLTNNDDYDTVFTTGVWSLDTWCYMISHPEDTKGRCILAGTDNSQHGYNIGYYNATKGGAGYWGFLGPGTSFTPSTNVTDTAPLYTWFHILMVCNWSGNNMTLKVYRDGKYLGEQTSSGSNQALSNFTDHSHVCIGGDAYTNIGGGTGSADKHNWHGYLFNWRYSGNDVTADSSDPLFTNSQTSTSSNNFVQGLPTRAYGAFGEDTPDVGTITLTATGAGDYTWSEVAGGTALPGSLAVGSTTHSGSGDSRTHTATVTGSFTALTSSFANGIRSDQTTNNILLKAQNDTDATKAITLGSSGGYDGIGITQKSSGNPILFNARRYMGNGTARDINDFGFAPDLVWVKNRDATQHHALFDTVRGATKRLISNLNSAEDTQAQFLTAFNSDGYSIGSSSDSMNANGQAIVAWTWKAGGVPSGDGKRKRSNSATEDSLSSGTDYNNITEVRQSVNVEGDFSITKYKGGNSNSNNFFKHGLSGKPDWVIIKRLTSSHWVAWHSSGDSGNSGAGDWILLSEGRSWGTDENNNAQTYAFFGTNGITNDKIYLQNDQGWTNQNNTEFICYAWKAVAGVSAFGSYTGNSTSSSVTAQTITTGFAPSFVIIKSISSNDSWWMFDNKRVASGTRNNTAHLRTDTNNDEANNSTSTLGVTLKTDNGFTVHDYGGGVNGNGNTYIYMAWA